MAVTRLRITFDMYSGVPNPVAVIEGEDADDLLRRIVPGEPIGPEVVTEAISQLGYRGVAVFQLGQLADHLPRSFRLAGGRLTGPGLRHWLADPEIEDFICSSAGPAGLALTRQEQFDGLVAGLAAIREPGWWWAEPAPRIPGAVQRCPTAPEAAALDWNDATSRGLDCGTDWFDPPWCVQCCNNCYNYATNIRTDDVAQPGMGSSYRYASTEGENICRAAFYDGLQVTQVAMGETCISGGILVAMTIFPGNDYHWYRKCDDGYWWHKQGATGVKDTDAAGVPITDPRTCAKGPYQFYTYMTVPSGGVRIAGPGQRTASQESEL